MFIRRCPENPSISNRGQRSDGAFPRQVTVSEVENRRRTLSSLYQVPARFDPLVNPNVESWAAAHAEFLICADSPDSQVRMRIIQMNEEVVNQLL